MMGMVSLPSALRMLAADSNVANGPIAPGVAIITSTDTSDSSRAAQLIKIWVLEALG